MKRTEKTIFAWMAMLGAVVLLSGCGGGDNTSAVANTAASTVVVSGSVADGYLVGAKVCLDKNYNDTCDADEPYVLSDQSGKYTFTLNEMAATELPIIVEADENTIDLDTNMPIGQKWHFRGVASSTFISPLTTLVATEMEMNASLTQEQIMLSLQSELGLTDINLTTDYIASNHTKAHTSAKIIAASLALAMSNLSAVSPSTDPRLIRLLSAKQIRAQSSAIRSAVEANNATYLCDVNTTDVDGQIVALQALIASSISEQMGADLLFMWEEERLARDVYNILYAKWGSKVFINIATNGEQTHIDSVKSMIDKYQVTTDGYEPIMVGVFVNPDLQALYNTLVAQGSISVIEAYKVGVLIEQTDIADLDARLSVSDLPVDIRTVYENLRKGSENHLAAFNKQL